MKDKYSFDRMLMHLDLSGEAPPGVPIIEIIGNSRILIENQVGICNYCKSSVVVKFRHGIICITGDNLELQKMNQNQLVITGSIFELSFSDWR